MSLNSSLNSTDSDVFYVEQLSDEPSPRRNNTPDVLNSTQRTDHQTMRMPSVSTIASPQPHLVTIDDDSNQITIPYGFGQQQPIVPPSLNDLNLPPNPFNILATMAITNNTGDDNDGYSPQSPEPSLPSPISTPPNLFNILATMAVVHPTQSTHDDNYSPQSPEPSELSSISTPPMNVSAFRSWETSYTSTDDNTFHSSDEPRRIYFLPPSPSPPPSPPRAQKRKLSLGMSFPKNGGVSQHICEACGQVIPAIKDTPGPSNRN